MSLSTSSADEITCRLPVKTLQLEQMAVMGSSEETSVVASRMQLVFSTLEVRSEVLKYVQSSRTVEGLESLI